jgi:hypothetical protein
MDLLKVEPGSDDETCHDGNHAIYIKVEDVTDIQEEEHPVLITPPLIKAEQEVCLLLCSFSFLSLFPSTRNSSLLVNGFGRVL